VLKARLWHDDLADQLNTWNLSNMNWASVWFSATLLMTLDSRDVPLEFPPASWTAAAVIKRTDAFSREAGGGLFAHT
jgi:hypothetical protein